ncbi:MAG: hypothetical protein LH606_13385 [Cytophagaceae bacterium]|nr:hypothetical protein [Cytophagaceae bacterium]
MNRVEHLLKEISQLTPEEVEQVYHELAKRVDRTEHASAVLEKYRGRGEGVWKEDAQAYVNTLRSDDRF